MKFIDECGRIKGKINIVDLFVILLFAVCIIAVGVKLGKKQETGGGSSVITYDVKIQGIREYSVDAIKKNYEGLIDAEKKENVGNIVNMEVSPWQALVQLDSGEYLLKEYDNTKYTAVITLECDGVETDEGYFTSSGRRIMVGDTIGFDNGYAQFFAEVINVDAQNKQ